jgi:hypothetical protein
MKNATLMRKFMWKGYKVSLSLYELTNSVGIGRHRIGYRMLWKSKLIFEGRDFGPSPLHAIDSRETALEVMGFLCLRKGDTDKEYFSEYTALQTAWSESSECEYLGADCSIEQEGRGRK